MKTLLISLIYALAFAAGFLASDLIINSEITKHKLMDAVMLSLTYGFGIIMGTRVQKNILQKKIS